MALNVTLLASMHDPLHLHYAAQSKVYDEEPARLFVSARGLCGASGAAVPNCTSNVNSSISSWALAGASSRIVDAWVTGEHELEGQDRCGDLLVVVDMGLTNPTSVAHLLTFDARCLSCGPLGVARLSTEHALHVRLTCDESTHPRAPHYALVTSGGAKTMSTAGGRRRAIKGALLAVDVSDPKHPRQVAQVADATAGAAIPTTPEGVFVHADFAYVGGCEDQRLVAVDLGGLPASLRVAAEWRDPAYVQLVSTQRHQLSGPARATMFLSLWGTPGGLAAFAVAPARTAAAHIRAPNVTEVGRLVTADLSAANRVVLQPSRQLAWLPLQQRPQGRFAAVDVSEPAALRLAMAPVAMPGDSAFSFCLAVDADDHVYAFSAPSATMHVYRVSNDFSY